jgi:LPXTG-motif cell wall-anchored protein
LALNLTPRRRFGVAIGVVLATVSTGLIGFAGTAGAHTNKSSAECKDDTTTLTVDLTAYRDEKKNTVKITDNGTVLYEDEFGKDYQDTFEVPGDVKHTFTIDVVAWDDPVDEDNKNEWSFSEQHVVEACVEVTEPPTETTETTPPSETTTTTTEAPPAPTSSEVAPPVATTPPTTTTPAVQEEALAETGASIALPLGIAGVLIVGGVGALFVVRRRSKA